MFVTTTAAPDNESEKYLATLFQPYLENLPSTTERSQLRMELRPLLPRHEVEAALERGEEIGKPRPAFWRLDGTTYPYAAQTAEMWSKRWEVYCGVFPRSGGRGRAIDVTVANWLYADFDGIYGLPPAPHMPQPQIVVKSGGGLHGYFKLTHPVQLSDRRKQEEFHQIMRRFVVAVGADTAVHDIARILRVPGTINHKYHPAREVSILCLDPSADARPIEWYAEHLPQLPRSNEQWSRRDRQDGEYGDVPQWLMERITTPAPPGHWNDYTLRSAVNLRRRGVPMDLVETLMQNFASVSGKADRIHHSELDRLMRWVERNIH